MLFVVLDCSVETRPATVKGQQRVGRKLRGKKRGPKDFDVFLYNVLFHFFSFFSDFNETLKNKREDGV